MRIRYVLERFLYRLSLTDLRNCFILKGGMLFVLWSESNYRPTKDLDFLLLAKGTEETIRHMINAICHRSVPEDDAMLYDDLSLTIEPINEDQQYEGFRINLVSFLGSIRIPIQIDIGIGDKITHGPVESTFKVIIAELPAPELKIYNRETMIAEKLQAMVHLDLANSRMKDFYDIWFIVTQLEFDQDLLCKAIAKTFNHRGTEFPATTLKPLSAYFWEDRNKQIQWKAFMRKIKTSNTELTLKQVCIEINEQLSGIFLTLQKEHS